MNFQCVKPLDGFTPFKNYLGQILYFRGNDRPFGSVALYNDDKKWVMVSLGFFRPRESDDVMFERAAEMLYRDSHQFSTRGCGTCQSISVLLGFDFGCVKKAKEQKP